MQVTKTTSSGAMEKEPFCRCINGVKDAGLNISMVATDHHTDTAALCRTAYPEINHQFDVWHVCKNLSKKLAKAGKQRECKDLLPWVQSICNHLWWSCETCEWNADLLKDKWLSVLHHTANLHNWEHTTSVSVPILHFWLMRGANQVADSWQPYPPSPNPASNGQGSG